ncbi:hypothetical protein NKT34_23395 [Paenibacillus polysaccharolyticus]|uniref:hypothetical protein n=1 Tax=Paenibacillus polysaccharolyticus TaxID=582692 RepID=UPI00209F463A|nr:hypothetical protein [Paenibacillus polysaccharolyticus]MCP1136247.1 hypothetical protein [Paenibacillus polysaccharolyticus]
MLFQVTGISIVAFSILASDYKFIPFVLKKERVVAIFITGAAYALAILLLFKPDLPSFHQIMDIIFRPLGRFLE